MSEDLSQRLSELCTRVEPTDPAVEDHAWDRLDSLTKPPRSLGRLEDVAARLCRIRGAVPPSLGAKAVLVAAGDHGVVARGVAAYPQEVTAQMVANFAAGGAAINAIAKAAGARVVIADVGVKGPVAAPGVREMRIAEGTADMTAGPAMTKPQALQALLAGASLAEELADHGVGVLALGEMGIGNTTAAAALTSAFTQRSPEDVVGPGTGLDAVGVARKAGVVREALQRNGVDGSDAFATLAAVGGLEIAALAGAAIGAAARGCVVLADGFVSTSALLAAVGVCPAVRERLMASHLSPEPGHAIALGQLGLRPLLELSMRLGEGTGAALAMPLLDAAVRVLTEMATFDEAGVSGAEAG